MLAPALFDRTALELRPLSGRGHDLRLAGVLPLTAPPPSFAHPSLPALTRMIASANSAGPPVILFVGAHPLKLGLQRYLIDLVQRRLVTHVATNGAGLIHDYELALTGGTSEDVPRWLSAGQFGLWQETSSLNDLIAEAARRRDGLGEGVGRAIAEGDFPHNDLSVAAACWRAGTPFTVHVTIGADIIHGHPNCDGAALGQTSHTDFLIFARSVQDLEGGVFLNVGSAVTGPEVFLKALSLARNVAHQRGQRITDFTTAVFDLVPLPATWREGLPGKDDPLYYHRGFKTVLVRAVADGGRSFYVQGDHRDTLPALWHLLTCADPQETVLQDPPPQPPSTKESEPCN